LGAKPQKVLFEFDPNGALATTFETQGSAMGLAAGLMDWQVTHPEMHLSIEKVKDAGINLEFKIAPIKASHPNTYQVTAEGDKGENLTCTAVSTGGGMIEFVEIDGFRVSLKGDFYESLFFIKDLANSKSESLKADIKSVLPSSDISFVRKNGKTLLIIQSSSKIPSLIRKAVDKQSKVVAVKHAEPVLPILSQSSYRLPFRTFKEMLKFAGDQPIKLSELALEYESNRAGISVDEVFKKMRELVEITRNGIKTGLKGTQYDDRILGQQSHLILKAEQDNVISTSPVNKMIAYTSALMEVKSSMGVIIAAPTAGACGVLGGALFGSAGLDVDTGQMTNAFLAAGMVGIFVADEYTFAAEEGGCQVECGAGSGMAAAGLVELMGGNYRQATRAASMAMQNMIGLICDPVADRVEVPCLGKNILGATNALNAANMSMAGYAEVIPLDEVIDAIKKVGAEMPSSLCCTGLGGLSTTPCSKSIFEQLKNKAKAQDK
jgi:L-serine dehydratase